MNCRVRITVVCTHDIERCDFPETPIRRPTRRYGGTHDHADLHAAEGIRGGRRRSQSRGTRGLLKAALRQGRRLRRGQEKENP